ncbi:MAG TPA: pseudouridine-5'-phosphate glycosidase, partial [Xanthomonadales bacterium]|nr:pseudouridine-5'-phosphate glycosidase [Xanthomonadales bacterium]
VMPTFEKYLSVSAEVQQALARGLPVLALESTLISHGLAWPHNLETALAIEAGVRAEGVVPATVAVLDGQLRVGLESSDIERLARLWPEARKCSRRDLSSVLQTGQAGATTVAATMMVAAMAGIRVFTTGGIGGVHRGAAMSFDISADLQELARTPVAVVCSGPKAILDIGLTCEYLETHGVPVLGYQCDTLPAFYSRDSAYPVDQRYDCAADIARALQIQWSLGLAGALVVNPIPQEHALDQDTLEQAIAQAVAEADAARVKGKALTPWLLARLEQLSGGDSVQANIALLLNNARLGAQIAVAMAAISNPAHDR